MSKSTTYQFETMLEGVTCPCRPTFMEAWNDMYLHVKSRLDSNTLSMVELNECLWIETVAQSETGPIRKPINFYDARDLAIKTYNWKQPK